MNSLNMQLFNLISKRQLSPDLALWLTQSRELPMFRTNFHGPKDVRAMEVVSTFKVPDQIGGCSAKKTYTYQAGFYTSRNQKTCHIPYLKMVFVPLDFL